MKQKSLLLIALISCTNVEVSQAQWNSNTSINNPISTEINHQQVPRITSDSQGGAIITWIDFRTDIANVIGDIYAQRIKADGSIAWTSNGISICANAADQTEAFIVEDGKGGAIISWQDIRSGNRDIYAQRIDSNGTALWTTNGIGVAVKSGQQRSPKIISDGANGAIIAWEDSINGNSDIFVQRVLASGTLAWFTGGIPVCISAGIQMNARLTTDGSNGAIITWQDKRNGNDYDIYAQRVTSAGTASWTTNGVTICSKVNTQNNPKIESDHAGGAYIMWADKRGAIDFDVYAQRINSAGTVAWAANGIAVSAATGSQSAIDASTDGVSNGIFIAWKDSRTAYERVYGQFINGAGNASFTANGVLLSTNALTQLNPNMIGVGNNEVVVTWQDSSSGNWDIYAQKMNLQSATVWNNAGILVSNASGNQLSPKNCSNGDGGSIIVFQDRRNADNDIYASQINSNGTISSVATLADEIKINCYPNPASDVICLNGASAFISQGNIAIYDITGKHVLSERLTSASINIHSLDAGMYVMKLYNQKNELISQTKFTKYE
jgi:hypothetical protein